MKKFPFSLLIVKELYTFVKTALAILSVIAAENTYIKALCKSLADANADLERALGKSLTSEFTSVLFTKDKIRDDIFKGLRDFINSFTHSQISAKASAAVYLWNVLENIGLSIYRHPYTIETAELNTLISNLKTPEATQALTTLGGKEWLDQLIAAQADFEATYKNKVDVETAIDIPLANASRETLIDCMDCLFNYIYGNSKYEPAIFSPLKFQIEEVCTDVLARARARITIAAREKKEEQKLDVESEIKK